MITWGPRGPWEGTRLTIRELMQGVDCRVPPALLDRPVSGVTLNSREAEAGSLFFAIQGERADGHHYAAKALEAGAAAVVVERDLGLDRQILAANTRAAYALACGNLFGNPARRLRLIGVTGTNGKTTVSYLIKSILEETGKKVGLIGTIRNEIGSMKIPAHYTTPDPYALHSLFARMAEAGCDYVVMEVSSHGLDQHRLEGCRFEAGVFTNLTQDHLDYHHTMENYFQAKKKLFQLSAKGVINYDDPYGRRLLKELTIPCTSFSVGEDAADYTARNLRSTIQGSSFAFVGKGMIARIRLAMPGAFSVSNAMAALSCALCLGVPLEEAAQGLSRCPGVLGRAEVIAKSDDYTIIRDYAHTGDGLEKILSTVREFAPGRLVVLFGCAGNRDASKRPDMAAIAARLADFCILTSDNPRHEDAQKIIDDALPGFEGSATPYKVILNRYEAIRWALDHLEKGDTLVLAGKGHEDYQVLADETIWFDEREIVRRMLDRPSP